MAVTISRPSGRRADDVRALRFRFRQLTFSGNYATGGETITARSLGLKRILMVIPGNVLVRPAADTANGVLPVFDLSSDGTSLTIRMLEDAAGAAGVAIGQEKTNAEAYTAGSRLDVVFIGE